MSPGFAAYIVVLAVTYVQALRSTARFSRELQARGYEGLFMDDPRAARRYLDNPLLAFRDGFLTKGAKAASTPHPNDPDLERSRRSMNSWGLLAVVWTLAGLPLI